MLRLPLTAYFSVRELQLIKICNTVRYLSTKTLPQIHSKFTCVSWVNLQERGSVYLNLPGREGNSGKPTNKLYLHW